jgi:putative transposase
VAPTGPNHVWAYDFVFDTSATGQQIKCLTVVDEWTREALAIDVAGSIRSGCVIEVLAKQPQRSRPGDSTTTLSVPIRVSAI